MRLAFLTTRSDGIYIGPLAEPPSSTPPIQPGAWATIDCALQTSVPLHFARMIIGPLKRSMLGTSGLICPDELDEAGEWSIDEVKVDGLDVVPGDSGDCGVGSRIFMRVTNVGTKPAHFNATFEMEDVQ